jgi:hypothetical protein
MLHHRRCSLGGEYNFQVMLVRPLTSTLEQAIQCVQAQSQLPRNAPLEQRPSTNRGRDRGFTGTNGPARGEWNLRHQPSRVRDADRRKGRQFA